MKTGMGLVTRLESKAQKFPSARESLRSSTVSTRSPLIDLIDLGSLMTRPLQFSSSGEATMYDPVIVDTFFRVHATMPKEPERKGPASEVLNTITYSGRTPAADYTTAHARTVTLYELVRALAGQISFDEAADIIARHLQHLIPSSLCAFYFYDASRDELEAKHIIGFGASALKGMRIQLGQRLSGWVAANRQSILNSDAALDLGDVEPGLTMRSCLSTALVAQDTLVGVLTLYSTELNGFDDDSSKVNRSYSRSHRACTECCRQFRWRVSALMIL